jgi:predicted site-specific integrase-resolvase
MKLTTWAKKQGIHYNTALRWFKAGKIQNAKQLDTGTIIVDEVETTEKIEEMNKRLEKIEKLLSIMVSRGT